MLRQNDLLVERAAVSKINKVDYSIPLNVVTVDLSDQIPGEQSTRTLAWDSWHTIEEPREVKIGDTAKLPVELALQRDEHDRAVYRYKITDEAAGIDQEGTDLHLGARLPADNNKAAKTLLSQLYAAGEAYETELEGGIDTERLDRFDDDRVNEWAYLNMEHIEVAQVELIRGFER
jgi:hypothetical protein